MTNRDKHRQDWALRVADYKASGLTMSAWCAANSLSKESLKYWLRKLRNSSPTSSSTATNWLPLTVTSLAAPDASPIIVRIGQASIELRPDFDPYLFRQIVHALESPC
ncbi:IS66 family insertion sequence element accessory protein TnpA [Paenibacillus xylaniclasticus]|uniref:IS66 family insertion sequence element accessory protein TnpA n=1 Tax=Paenibacillus xylaniclasticus TaxID=588083 RepID=UPI000FD7E58A